MANRLALGALLLSVFGLAVSAFLMPGPKPPVVSRTGRPAAFPHGTVAFQLTNPGPATIVFIDAEVQVSTNGVWRTLSSETVSIPEVEPGTSNLNIFSGRLEPGQHVALAVEPPRNRIWRVGVHYAPEHTGLRSLWVRARLIWKTRNLCWRRGPVWTYSGEQAFSNEITQ